MKYIVSLLLLVILLLTIPASAQTVVTPPAGAVTAPAAAPAPATPAVKPAAPTERLGLLKRIKLGLTVKNLTPIVKDLKAKGELTGDSSVDSITVAKALMEKNPQLFKAEAGADWEEFFDALISFLEKLLPLILQLIEIFGGV